jgi:hypothetical protein
MTDNRRTITIPVTFNKANRRKDRSVSIAMESNLEISTPDFAILDTLVGSAGWLTYTENADAPLDNVSPPSEDAPSDRKSPSQRVRALLFLAWKQNTDQREDFEAYYRRRMERLIDLLKGELD